MTLEEQSFLSILSAVIISNTKDEVPMDVNIQIALNYYVEGLLAFNKIQK